MNFPAPRTHMKRTFTELSASPAVFAFSLRGARGEGGRFVRRSLGEGGRPDEGCGHLRRRTEPLTPALSPHPMKGEGEELLQSSASWTAVAERSGDTALASRGAERAVKGTLLSPLPDRKVLAALKRGQECPLHGAFALFAALVFAFTSPASAADAVPPGKLAFQGFLTDASGQPLGVPNPVKPVLTFRIYRNATGTAPADIVWSESQTVVVDQGQYTALLGNGAAVGTEPNTNHLATVFTGADASDRFLGVTVAGQSEIRPRIQFFASPFAQFSGSATMLVSAGGNSLLTTAGNSVGVNLTNAPSTALEVGGSLKATTFVGSGAQLTGVSVSAARVTGTLTAAQITDGTLTGAKVPDSSIGVAQLTDGTVGPGALNTNTVAALAAQIGGVGSGAIIVSTNANNATLAALGFVNLGPATLDGESWTIKAFNGAPNAPSPRQAFTASSDIGFRMSAWTGSKWIVWGGNAWGGGVLGNGAIFDPALGTWTPMSSVNAPSARKDFQTAWTGTRFLIWGGTTGNSIGDGRLYDPATDKWTTMAGPGRPGYTTNRTDFTGVWTGTEFIVWGGQSGGIYWDDGAIYNPDTDTWRAMAPSPLAGRHLHSAVWTGTEMIIQNGSSSVYYDDGARYNPATDTWTPMPFNPMGKSRSCGAVWTGTEMIIYGGFDGGNVHGGARYNPVSNTWKQISPGFGTLSARYRPLVAWTGHEMIIYGGGNTVSGLNDGVRYNPATDTWVTLGDGFNFIAAGANVRLHDGFYTWTGSEFLWLGFWNDGGNNAVYSYRPPRAAYLYAKP